MVATSAPQPNWSLPIADRQGYAANWFRLLVQALYQRTGGAKDKVDSASTLAVGAVPQGTQVVAAGGLQQGGSLGGNVGLALYRAIAPLASLPVTGNAIGDLAYALDARKPGEGGGAGRGVVVFWNQSSAWFSMCSGAPAAT